MMLFLNFWFLINYDVILDNNRRGGGGGLTILCFDGNTYSSVPKGMKENQECTNGDYLFGNALCYVFQTSYLC